MDYYDLLLAKNLGGNGGGSGGSTEWKRPADWPDLSKLDRTGEVLYLTYPADVDYGFIVLTVTSNCYVDIGHIESNEFVQETRYEPTSNSSARYYFGSESGGYKVIRITPRANNYSISKIDLFYSGQGNVDGNAVCSTCQRVLEIFGNAPYCATFDLRQCSFLQSVDVKNLKTAPSFGRCLQLKNIVLGGIDTSNVTDLSSRFEETNLEKIDLSSWNTSNVTNFSNMFKNCTNLKELVLPSGFVKSSATTLASMFANDYVLESVNMSGWNTSNVTTMEYLFGNCYCLLSGDLSSLNMSSMTSDNATRNIFEHSKLKVFRFPSTLTKFNGNAFWNNTIVAMFSPTLHFESTTPPALVNSLPSFAQGGKIYVPYSADHSILNAYKTATNWINYADYIFEESA